MPPFPSWLWFLIAILVILAILYLVGVRFDLDAADMIVIPRG